MCGICGIFSQKHDITRDVINRMRDTMIHRGPDGAGTFVSKDKCIGLGHRRLKVIDLTDNAHQPMMNEENTLCMICNGEVYNHDELRSSLKKKGHRFISTSDNEVILHLYEEYGIDFLNMLDGDFAFALWDIKKELLYVVRDRLGVKPCFYYYDKNTLVFASEIKALLQIKNIPRDINTIALHHYLTFGTVPAPHTMFKQIKKLLPGHYLAIKRGRVKIEKFWNADVLFNEFSITRNENDILEQFVSLMKKSIKKRLMSDAPLGVFLSGGVDSSVIVALMSELTQNVKTYSIVFENRYSCDESGYSRIIARRFNTDHHEFMFEDKQFNRLPDIIKYFDEPFAIPSVVPLFFLSEFARKDIKVTLTGDGGDELFAGYRRYYWDALYDNINRLGLSLLVKPFAHIINLTPHFLLSVKMNKIRDLLRKRIALVAYPSDIRYLGFLSYISENMKHSLYTDHMKLILKNIDSTDVVRKHYEVIGNRDNLTRRIYGDIMTTLPDEMLAKGDRMSMKNSIENRVPFLDQNILEFSARLASQYKLKGRTGKYIVKKSMGNLLPKNILYRRKMGFNVPLGYWLRNDLRWMVSEYLHETKIRSENLFDVKQINKLVYQFINKNANFEYQIFPLIVFEMWYSESIKNW